MIYSMEVGKILEWKIISANWRDICLQLRPMNLFHVQQNFVLRKIYRRLKIEMNTHQKIISKKSMNIFLICNTEVFRYSYYTLNCEIFELLYSIGKLELYNLTFIFHQRFIGIKTLFQKMPRSNRVKHWIIDRIFVFLKVLSNSL